MRERLTSALMAGSERVTAWSDLLDEINVFPVADGDTGRNLKISLAPLIDPQGLDVNYRQQLVLAATGNSGSIMAAFLSGFLSILDGTPFTQAATMGRDVARKAVADPKPGTMLSLFDALEGALDQWPQTPGKDDGSRVIHILDDAVRQTPEQLPALKAAGVVDAGALGAFVFFEGFFRDLLSDTERLKPATKRFQGFLRVTGNGDEGPAGGYCINATLTPPPNAELGDLTAELGESVVTVADGNRLRLHLHTDDQERTRNQLTRLGQMSDWHAEPLTAEPFQGKTATKDQAVRVMTDAAGSLTRAEAKALGVILLDSYLVMDGRRVPETLLDPQQLYRAMDAGRPVSTAQGSLFGRHQSYESALSRHDRVIYLAVGSVFTGNVAAAREWRKTLSQPDRFEVVDTGAASGRLGLIVRLVAEFAQTAGSLSEVADFADTVVQKCGELLFLEQLKFLVAGGRLSRSKGFFGDLLGIKPVICPRPEGAVKIGSVRNTGQQLDFALDYLKKQFYTDDHLTLLLQFSDNRTRLAESIQPALEKAFPRARIMTTPLSLTTGAHTGPGTWGVAFCPAVSGKPESP